MTDMLAVRETSCVGVTTARSLVSTITRRTTAARDLNHVSCFNACLKIIIINKRLIIINIFHSSVNIVYFSFILVVFQIFPPRITSKQLSYTEEEENVLTTFSYPVEAAHRISSFIIFEPTVHYCKTEGGGRVGDGRFISSGVSSVQPP